jgi:hypothetical protein
VSRLLSQFMHTYIQGYGDELCAQRVTQGFGIAKNLVNILIMYNTLIYSRGGEILVSYN